MADSSVAITAGSGTSISTRTNATGEHIQVMTLGIDGSDSIVGITADGVPVLPRPETSGGLTYHHKIGANTTNATSLKGSAGQLYGWMVTSQESGWVYVKFYNKASAPTVGSDTVVFALGIPPGGGANQMVPHGIVFSTGIAYSIVAGITDGSTTAISADKVQVALFYK